MPKKSTVPPARITVIDDNTILLDGKRCVAQPVDNNTAFRPCTECALRHRYLCSVYADILPPCDTEDRLFMWVMEDAKATPHHQKEIVPAQC